MVTKHKTVAPAPARPGRPRQPQGRESTSSSRTSRPSSTEPTAHRYDKVQGARHVQAQGAQTTQGPIDPMKPRTLHPDRRSFPLLAARTRPPRCSYCLLVTRCSYCLLAPSEYLNHTGSSPRKHPPLAQEAHLATTYSTPPARRPSAETSTEAPTARPPRRASPATTCFDLRPSAALAPSHP